MRLGETVPAFDGILGEVFGVACLVYVLIDVDNLFDLNVTFISKILIIIYILILVSIYIKLIENIG